MGNKILEPQGFRVARKNFWGVVLKMYTKHDRGTKGEKHVVSRPELSKQFVG